MTQKPQDEGPPTYAFGPFRMDVAERRLRLDDADIPLTRKAFDLLLALIENAGRLQTREALIDALWPNTIVEEHSLTWNLSALRRALGDTGDAPRYIETVRGHGYRFIAAVENVATSSLVGGEGSPASIPLAGTETAPEIASSAAAGRPARGAAGRAPRRGWPLAIFAAVLLAAVLAVLVRRSAEQASPPSTPPATLPHSVAVLPFENLSTDPGNAYFVSGIEDIILTKLAGIGDLRVISRRSTENYKSRPDNLRSVVEQLNVATVLEGSVQRSGDQVLISVQLIDGRSGDHLWAQAYPRTLDNVFQIESDVAEQVAAALKAKLLPAEAARVARAPTADAQAYDEFLKAEFLFAQIDSDSTRDPAAATRDARRLYEKAIALDPRFALAHARLSYLDSHAYWYDIDHTAQRIAAAEQAATRALELEPDLPQAHFAQGYIYYYGRRDFAAAIVEFERARQGLPGSGDIDAALASIQRRQNRWDDSIAGFERAATLDPRNPRWPMLLGDTLTVLRRYDEAVKAYDRAVAVDPNDYAAAIYKSLALLMAGQPDAAAQALTTIPAGIDPGGLASTLRFEVARIGGDADAALAAIAAAPDWIEAPYAPAFTPTSLLRAQAWVQKGDAARAREAYTQARDALRTMLRDQPDHPALLSLLGLAEAGLGEKDAAIDAGRRATELLPVARDALDGPALLAALAEIHATFGDDETARSMLQDLLKIPAGRVISAARLERDPRFKSLREGLRSGSDHR